METVLQKHFIRATVYTEAVKLQNCYSMQILVCKDNHYWISNIFVCMRVCM